MKILKKRTVKVLLFGLLMIACGILLERIIHEREITKKEQDLYYKIDSLHTLLEYVRFDEEVMYFHWNKDTIMSILPEAEWHDEVTCAYKGIENDLKYDYCRLLAKKKPNDTIYFQTYHWKLPYNKLFELEIIFELQKDSSWIAVKCIQWNSDEVYLDIAD